MVVNRGEDRHIMDFNKYYNSCLIFRNETMHWDKLNLYKFYTTGEGVNYSTLDAWNETDDNAHGGIDVSWRFHHNAIVGMRVDARQKYSRIILELWMISIGEKWNYEQMKTQADFFEDENRMTVLWKKMIKDEASYEDMEVQIRSIFSHLISEKELVKE